MKHTGKKWLCFPLFLVCDTRARLRQLFLVLPIRGPYGPYGPFVFFFYNSKRGKKPVCPLSLSSSMHASIQIRDWGTLLGTILPTPLRAVSLKLSSLSLLSLSLEISRHRGKFDGDILRLSESHARAKCFFFFLQKQSKRSCDARFAFASTMDLEAKGRFRVRRLALVSLLCPCNFFKASFPSSGWPQPPLPFLTPKWFSIPPKTVCLVALLVFAVRERRLVLFQ